MPRNRAEGPSRTSAAFDSFLAGAAASLLENEGSEKDGKENGVLDFGGAADSNALVGGAAVGGAR